MSSLIASKIKDRLFEKHALLGENLYNWLSPTPSTPKEYGHYALLAIVVGLFVALLQNPFLQTVLSVSLFVFAVTLKPGKSMHPQVVQKVLFNIVVTVILGLCASLFLFS